MRLIVPRGIVFAVLALTSIALMAQTTQPGSDPAALTSKATAGDVAAMYRLGAMYFEGQGVAKDYQQAHKWFEAAAARNYTPAINGLARMYIEGAGVDRDPAVAAQFFMQGAELNDALSQFSLAELYARGAGVPRDPVAAYKWLLLASLNGHPKANVTLQQYAPGMSPTDIAEAQRQASAIGLPRLLSKAQAGDRTAQSQLGMAYATGQWTQRDDAKAIEWFRKAAVQGDAQAQYALGDFYANGRGVNLDYAQAAKWMRMAAEAGDPRAQATLGSFYDIGTGVARSDAEAFKWSMKAAQQGSAEGQYNVGFAYANGKGVPKDDRHALEWYEKSSAQGFFNATNNAAWLLATSKEPGVRNPVRAIQFAQQVVDATAGKYPVYFDTLARCYYENGQMAEAIAAERKALELAPTRDEFKVTLDRYVAIQALQARRGR